MRTLAERLNGLRWRLRATRRLWSRGVGPSHNFLPRRRTAAPVGEFDNPRPGDEVYRAALRISGWLLLPSGPTARIELFLNGRSLGPARLGIGRKDLEEIWDHAHARTSGFELSADLGDWDGGNGEANLVAVASGVHGERFELGPVPLRVAPESRERPKLPAPPTRTPHAQGGERPRVLVCTHELGLGGAQLYLLDLLRGMVAEGSATFTVVSALDGPVRKDIEGLGIPVHISSLVPYDDLSSHIGRVEELVAWAEPRDFDVALVNTATALSFPGAEAAEQLGIPVVWAIHESFSPAVLWSELTPAVRDRAEAALANATTLVFEAEATQRLFEPVAGAARCITLPYGLDLEEIEAHRGKHDVAAARRKAGIPANAQLIACIGTIEPRKAQLMLAQAFELIGGRHPRARVAFVGGRDDEQSEALSAYIRSSPLRDRMEVIPITPDVEAWYGMADLLVCASDVESLPRTVLEAMVWETPVLTTAVFGLPELITHGETGWLCEPRDLRLLAGALSAALEAPAEQQAEIARAARDLVAARHSLPKYAKQISQLLEDAAEGSSEAAKRRIASG